jgi:hypothetical protein
MKQLKKDYTDILININGQIQHFQILLNVYNKLMMNQEIKQWVQTSIFLIGVILG